MVRHVLVKIGKDQQQLKHAVALIWIRIPRAFLKVFYDCKRVRQQPFQIVRVKLFALMRPFERFICAEKRFVEKMVQAKPLAR
jgi:hypothetical protein